MVDLSERAATQKPTRRQKRLTHNSRAGNPERPGPNCHEEKVLSNQRDWRHCTREGAQGPQCAKGMGPKDTRTVLSRTQVSGRRDATHSRSLRPAYRHLEPPEVCPLRVIQGRPTYTSEVACRQEVSGTVMSEFDIFVSSPIDDIMRATDVMIVGKRASVCLSVVLVVVAVCRM